MLARAEQKPEGPVLKSSSGMVLPRRSRSPMLNSTWYSARLMRHHLLLKARLQCADEIWRILKLDGRVCLQLIWRDAVIKKEVFSLNFTIPMVMSACAILSRY
jgi:hypothetical protein